MNASARQWSVLLATLAWASVACANAGGEAARVDQSALTGEWSNSGGERLLLGADRTMAWEGLNSAVLGGSSCPNAAVGHWTFFGPPDNEGTSLADDALTSGTTVALSIDNAEDTCLLSAEVRRDEQGVNLCLVVDPDSSCSLAKELLRRKPATPPEQTTK